MRRAPEDKKKEVEELLNATNLSFHGVAVGVSNKYTESLTEINIESNRMIGIKLEVGGKKLAIFNVYLPTSLRTPWSAWPQPSRT